MFPWTGGGHRWIQAKITWLYWTFFLLSLLTLALIASAAVSIWKRPDEGFSWSPTHQVIELDPTGPGAKAGVQTGDVLVELDGVPITAASYLYADKKPGDQVTFSLRRQEQSYTVPVTLRTTPPALALRRLGSLTIALCLWLISILFVSLKPTARASQLFFLYIQVGAGTLAVGEFSAFNVAWAAGLLNVLLCLLFVLIFYLHIFFPLPKSIPRRKLLVGFSYGLSLILALSYVLLNPARFQTFSWYPIWHTSVRLALTLSILTSVSLIFYTCLTAPKFWIRRHVGLILLGTIWAAAPTVFLFLPHDVLTSPPFIALEIAFLSLPLIPLAYSTTSYQYKLLDIDRFLNRSLVHFNLGLVWVGLYLLLATVLNALFPKVMFARPLLGALVTLLMAMALVPLRQKIQKWVDRLFYGGWYDYRSVVASVSGALSGAQDEATLVEQLVHRVTVTMSLRGAALFLADESGALTLRGSTGFELLPGMETCTASDGSLAQLLRREARPLETPQVQQWLTDESSPNPERTWLEVKYAQLWLPLVFKEELQGALLLGAKKGNAFFDTEDLTILATLAHQAALAAENVRLLGTLRRQVEQLTLLREELEVTHRRLLTSREEERKRLARELHDRLLQELFALNIGLQTVTRMTGDAPLVERLVSMRRDVVRLADETRRLCTELRPPALSAMGLADAIRSYTGELAGRWGNVRVIGGFYDVHRKASRPRLTITLDLDRDRKCLDDQVAIALFRVYQEALANVEKHAAAENVWVRERLENGRVELSIRDNGCGFIVPGHLGQFVRQGHFGLLGVKERIATVGGEMWIASQPGAGTEIRVWAPADGDGKREKQ
jgi:signal transduction histidine kinase